MSPAFHFFFFLAFLAAEVAVAVALYVPECNLSVGPEWNVSVGA